MAMFRNPSACRILSSELFLSQSLTGQLEQTQFSRYPLLSANRTAQIQKLIAWAGLLRWRRPLAVVRVMNEILSPPAAAPPTDASEKQLIDRLSGEDKLEIDRALKIFDRWKDADAIHRVVNRVLERRGLTIHGTGLDSDELEMVILNRKGEPVGTVMVSVEKGVEERPALNFTVAYVEPKYQNKRIIPLVLRGLATEPDLRNRFAGYPIKSDANRRGAKLWRRIGFFSAILKSAPDGRYLIEGSFPLWNKDSHLIERSS